MLRAGGSCGAAVNETCMSGPLQDKALLSP
jgi:hypothetical protein